MTCIIVDMENWERVMKDNPDMFDKVGIVAAAENPFTDNISVTLSLDDNHSIIDLVKGDKHWSAYIHIPERPDLFLYSDMILPDEETNNWRFEYSSDNASKSKHLSDGDRLNLMAGIIHAIQVVYYINNMDTVFTKPQRHLRRRLRRSSKSLKEQVDFYTLDLSGKKPSNSSGSNGEGSGRRYHLRRGHYHNYNTKEGVVRKWLKPTWCGDETSGRINKTYKV